jgi:DNA-binding GntR family transcriptional regulator
MVGSGKLSFWHTSEDLKHRSKTESFQEYLYAKLRTGEFPPGKRLRQDELAQSLGISSTPVREGLSRLIAEGLLTYVPNKGVTVREPQPSSVSEVYAIRIELEGLAAREAAKKLSQEDLERLSSLHQQMADLQSPDKRRAFSEVNDEFHWIICQAAGSELLLSIVRRLWAASPWDGGLLLHGRSSLSVKEHGAILQALQARDPLRAEESMDNHLRSFAESILAVLESDDGRTALPSPLGDEASKG